MAVTVEKEGKFAQTQVGLDHRIDILRQVIGFRLVIEEKIDRHQHKARHCFMVSTHAGIGDTVNIIEPDDRRAKRFHHIINPKTGDSARLVQSASVIGPEATITDALSTTVFILGVKRGIELIEILPEYDVIFIAQHSKLHFSSGLQPAIAPDVPAN